jgi:hypothetical protein
VEKPKKVVYARKKPARKPAEAKPVEEANQESATNAAEEEAQHQEVAHSATLWNLTCTDSAPCATEPSTHAVGWSALSIP